MTMLKYLDKKQNAPYCSICGNEEHKCSENTDAVICSYCTVVKSWRTSQEEKDCPECGKRKIAGNRDICPTCKRKAERAERKARLDARNERRAKRLGLNAPVKRQRRIPLAMR